jgi:26S proteasome regulatory subunit N1
MSLAGLLVVLTSGLDLRATLGGKSHYLLFALATSLAPRMLMTLDEGGKLLPVPCRVGTAVDVVAQAGKPKAITGFQTHDTPVSGTRRWWCNVWWWWCVCVCWGGAC